MVGRILHTRQPLPQTSKPNLPKFYQLFFVSCSADFPNVMKIQP